MFLSFFFFCSNVFDSLYFCLFFMVVYKLRVLSFSLCSPCISFSFKLGSYFSWKCFIFIWMQTNSFFQATYVCFFSSHKRHHLFFRNFDNSAPRLTFPKVNVRFCISFSFYYSGFQSDPMFILLQIAPLFFHLYVN